jgi:hypothetical protein
MGISRLPLLLAAGRMDARVSLSFADQGIQNSASVEALYLYMDPAQWCF